MSFARADLHRPAAAEIDEAAAWYFAQDGGERLTADFLAELERVSLMVRELPRARTEIESGIRRAVFRRFPYSLIYAVKSRTPPSPR